jgi:hypothetical protein
MKFKRGDRVWIRALNGPDIAAYIVEDALCGDWVVVYWLEGKRTVEEVTEFEIYFRDPIQKNSEEKETD